MLIASAKFNPDFYFFLPFYYCSNFLAFFRIAPSKTNHHGDRAVKSFEF